MEVYYPYCGNSICNGCVHSFRNSGNDEKCPFCNYDGSGKTVEEMVRELMKRVEAIDAFSIYMLANSYCLGLNGVQQDQTKAIELYDRSADLGSSKAHFALGCINKNEGDMKKARSL